MKSKNTLLYAAAGLVLVQLFVSSCSSTLEITKRHYRKGFYVDLAGNNTKQQVVNGQVNASKQNDVVEPMNSIPATGVDGGMEAVSGQSVLSTNPSSITASSDNSTIAVPVSKPVRLGHSSTVNAPAAASSLQANNRPTTAETQVAAKDTRDAKGTRKTHSGGKSQLVALLLCFFLGGLGIHRFYLGYTWQGVVQLLTLGGCGVWALIDFIRIIIGDLGPKDGGYDKTL